MSESEADMAQIGFLGLGAMGLPIATRLLDAGHDVLVWNRNPAAADELVTRGATLAPSASEALALPLSFSMLSNDAAVAEVLSQENLGTSTAERIHVCMSSISPAAADSLGERLAQAGGVLVSAPVMGRPAAAAEGKLNILAAGPESALTVVEPALLNCGVKVWRFGEQPRMANSVKIAANFMILHAIQSMGEALTLVESQGVDAADFIELLTSTMFNSPLYTTYGGLIVERNYTPPGFTMPLGLKDLKLAEDLAGQGGVTLPTAEVLHRLLDIALADSELAQLDWSALAEVTRQQRFK